MSDKGKVYLVGGGPGDPGLLTLKALDLLRNADVVVHDRLISAAILERVPRGTTRIPVGKASGHHSVKQEDINRLLVDLGRAGRKVVRLKGGDPFVFGRGSEEALALSRHGIAFEIVPGVTAASGCSAYAGVPLTHRGLARGVRFVTGHFDGDSRLELDWRALADPDCTLAVYMGLGNLEQLCRGLVRQGMDPATPAVAIQDGTTGSQRRVFGDITTLAERVEGSDLISPVMVIIGRTVMLAGELDWFDAYEEPANAPLVNAL